MGTDVVRTMMAISDIPPYIFKYTVKSLRAIGNNLIYRFEKPELVHENETLHAIT
jgi:hypothetical protein